MNFARTLTLPETVQASSADIVIEKVKKTSWLPPQGSELLAFLPTRLRFPLIGPALDAAAIKSAELTWNRADGIVGWGIKPLARMAQRLASIRGLPYWSLEDGFLRSVGLGKAGAPPVSMVADDLGVYFNAATPSRLEELLQRGAEKPDLERARNVHALIVGHRLTKYNHLLDYRISLPACHGRRILLIDQVAGDYSVPGAGADEHAFLRMWNEARAVPGAMILVKSHPDIVAGYAKGYLSDLARQPNVHFINESISPHALLDVVDEVWTVSSQFGFDAILRSVPVTTFGAPFYAGWGLTRDWAEGEIATAALKRRTCKVSLDAFVAATLLQYPVYVDPVTQHPVIAEKAIDRLVAWRHHALEGRGNYLCAGFSRHKRSTVRHLLQGPWSSVTFCGDTPSKKQLAQADYVVRWGQNASTPAPDALHSSSAPVLCMEDGFIRSAGLGSQLTPASSVCIDREGIYYDATRQSGLEKLLRTVQFDQALLVRAARLRQRIAEDGITKYNLQSTISPDYRALAAGRPVITVAGQVPDDASLRFGLTNGISNIELLRIARKRRPGAFLVYKEHPDLLAGKRKGRSDTAALGEIADLIVGNVAVDRLLDASDEVHVATSQLGFEALIRGCPVWCYGLPFYAGWGLTHDGVTPLRPRRKLSVDELIAGVLILYPRYLSGETGLSCEVEDVIDEIRATRHDKRSLLRRSLHRIGWA
ncbi:capsular polysaccharide biosynthesis protein [Phyllobacterium myrsinacearum]|uniref:Capsular polysaccharide export protein n=1 Tax=Phyllobacterium myrsinacearum TaxID=28101 RepID=A0A839EH99_9HYPH|nr:capsular polysaccharide biosynthesis protein [Phyllobacterium myrsinacearum]MBA8879361.1 capsular polysaccharide export protein [Phyllobacterium myrsinacearum]